ncbi:MAG: hypothetical protein EPN23_10750 [Verrucomicrobia bacterium]|nr:MAG: hypothetical protein EPN23_10750 [Verrucomicrobiota bacterium]
MWIQSLILKNIRSFVEAKVDFSKRINVLVGPNNAGKSTILLPLLGLQDGLPYPRPEDVRLGETEARAEITFGDCDQKYFHKKLTRARYLYRKDHNDFPLLEVIEGTNHHEHVHKPPGKEPGNFIYPFVSKRKVTQLGEQVSDGVVEAVPSTFTNLNAKIDRLSNPEFLPAHALYMRACDEILGFRVTTAHTGQGKRAVYTVRNMNQIPLLAMGEGVMNILGLVVHLAIAENQLFLIEEPENDVHPKALKALLDLIGEKSAENQFILTTHSNIVLKRLGSYPECKVLRVDSTLVKRMPTSSVREIDASPDSRREVLSELGYELHDVDMWAAWLILEESSAEKMIREYLIPWFVPSLGPRLRTYSAHSLSEVAPRFRDFNELLVFLHLEPAYKNKAWVLVDGGDAEKTIVDQLAEFYGRTGWNRRQFKQLANHNFEDYYPVRFADRVAQVKALADKKAKREAKRALLEEVEGAIGKNEDTLRAEFESSAAEVVAVLREIEESLSS